MCHTLYIPLKRLGEPYINETLYTYNKCLVSSMPYFLSQKCLYIQKLLLPLNLSIFYALINIVVKNQKYTHDWR